MLPLVLGRQAGDPARPVGLAALERWPVLAGRRTGAWQTLAFHRPRAVAWAADISRYSCATTARVYEAAFTFAGEKAEAGSIWHTFGGLYEPSLGFERPTDSDLPTPTTSIASRVMATPGP